MNLRFIRHSILPLILGQLGLALVQGVQFIIVARALGPHEFGIVASLAAITGALLPFSGLGSANTMVMHLARGSQEAHILYGNSLFAGACSGALMALAASGLYWVVTGDTSLAACCLVFCSSELVLTKLVDISQHVFLGLEKHAIASRFLLLQSALRLACALGMSTTMAHPTAWQWAWLHMGGGALAALMVLAYTRSQTGYLQVDLARLWSDVRTGVFFSLGLSARSVYMDIDKAVLAHTVSLSINGAYTAAFRLVFMATTPLTAGLLALQARMFRAGGEHGIGKTAQIAKNTIFAGLAYGTLVGIMLFVFAPLLPYVLGDKYQQSVIILQALAFLPIPLFIQSALSDALAAANFQRVRSMIQMAVAVLSFGLNTVLIKQMSWAGAVVSTYACQMALTLIMAYMVLQKLKDNRR
jgi:O-antigen/teichoic acid export membrane protein